MNKHYVVLIRYNQQHGNALESIGPFHTYDAAMEEMRRPPKPEMVSKSLAKIEASRIGNGPVVEVKHACDCGADDNPFREQSHSRWCAKEIGGRK